MALGFARSHQVTNFFARKGVATALTWLGDRKFGGGGIKHGVANQITGRKFDGKRIAIESLLFAPQNWQRLREIFDSIH